MSSGIRQDLSAKCEAALRKLENVNAELAVVTDKYVAWVKGQRPPEMTESAWEALGDELEAELDRLHEEHGATVREGMAAAKGLAKSPSSP
jgi:hypothetical protein